ncbi:YnfA family protein [Tepidiforma sp.]|uniref:YnfA family protein n=1 Tax=Tepidiforma sp. TaxID=2682230 RepID=UPI00260C19BD|nr:YnfA family protein [Tepidiforma sp.]MCX7618467.1 YnfA family protein [Tepidiforma sp.]
MPEPYRAILVFFLAGCAELFGSWLVWQWQRVDRPFPFGLAGAAVLFTYGLIHTLQSESEFGRIQAAYSGMFIVLALAWGAIADGWRPDRWDLAGAGLALAGMALMMFGPRG